MLVKTYAVAWIHGILLSKHAVEDTSTAMRRLLAKSVARTVSDVIGSQSEFKSKSRSWKYLISHSLVLILFHWPLVLCQIVVYLVEASFATLCVANYSPPALFSAIYFRLFRLISSASIIFVCFDYAKIMKLR